MSEEKQTQETNGNGSEQESRRRLLKGIVATTPVILSVTSRPVLAIRNCSESGQLSGNNSGDTRLCEGEGCSGNSWKTHLNNFHPNYPSTAIFDTVFGITLFGSATLGEVINKSAAPSRTCDDGTKAKVKKFGKQAVAALQNAATEVRFDLTVADVLLTVQNAYTGALLSNGKLDCSTLNTTTKALRTLNNQAPQNCPWNL